MITFKVNRIINVSRAVYVRESEMTSLSIWNISLVDLNLVRCAQK